MKTTLLTALLAAGILGSGLPDPGFSVAAQRGGGGGQGSRPGRTDTSGNPRGGAALAATTQPGIAWYGVWEDAVAEADRTGKPILLFSAAPQCRAVPGMW